MEDKGFPFSEMFWSTFIFNFISTCQLRTLLHLFFSSFLKPSSLSLHRFLLLSPPTHSIIHIPEDLSWGAIPHEILNSLFPNPFLTSLIKVFWPYLFYNLHLFLKPTLTCFHTILTKLGSRISLMPEKGRIVWLSPLHSGWPIWFLTYFENHFLLEYLFSFGNLMKVKNWLLLASTWGSFLIYILP